MALMPFFNIEKSIVSRNCKNSLHDQFIKIPTRFVDFNFSSFQLLSFCTDKRKGRIRKGNVFQTTAVFNCNFSFSKTYLAQCGSRPD
jgi:hypothetical protein